MTVPSSETSDGFTAWQWAVILFLLIVPVLYVISGTFKYYFRQTFYLTTVILVGFISIFFSLPRPRNTDNHRFIGFSSSLIQKALGIEILTKGEKYLSEYLNKPAILVINHQSGLDLLPLFYIFPPNCVCLAKKELWYSGTFGLAAWLCGTIYIDRLNPEHARKTMEDTASLIKNKKLKVVIFPEGTRNADGSLLPFKKGAFHLALQGQVPIIPIVFSSYKRFYDKRERKFEPGKILVEVLPPIPTAGLTTTDVTELTEKTRDQMLETYQRLNAQLKLEK